jgi:putative ABC transport system ATP-binding protein
VSNTVRSILSLAEHVGRVHGVEVVPHLARRHVEEARAVDPSAAPLHWLVRALPALGLRALLVPRTASEVVRDAARLVPIAAVPAEGSFLLVLQGRGRKVQVLDETERPVWLDARELAERVGAQDEDSPLEWLSSEPLLSCAPLSSHAVAPQPSHAPEHGADAAHHDTHATPAQRLRGMLKLERRDIAVLGIYAVVVSVLGLATPLAVQALVTTVSFGTLTQPVIVLALVVVLALGIAGALRALQLVVVESIQRRLFLRLVSDLAERLPRVRGDARLSVDTTKQVNRFFDVVTIQKAAATLLLDGMTLALELGVGLTLLALYNPLLLGFSAALIALLAFILFVLGKRAVKTSIEESWAKHAIADWFEEIARHPITFARGPAREAGALRADALAREYMTARDGHFRILLRQSIGLFSLQALAAAALLGVGGALVVRGQLTLGQLVAAELIVAVVVASLGKVNKQLEVVYDLLASLDKIGHLVDLPVERATGEDAAVTSGPAALRVTGAALSILGQPVLRGASLALSPGERLALLGASGTGKSTLVDAIQGVIELDGGHIELDGIDVRMLSKHALRRRVGVVRGPEVFEGSVAENLRAGDEALRTGALVDALRLVELEEEILGLPSGLHTQLRHGGAPLSASQALRLTIARVLASAPGLLVLDGALDEIEPPRRKRILDRIASSGRYSVLVATHAEDVVSSLPHGVAVHDGVIAELARLGAPPARGAT